MLGSAWKGARVLEQNVYFFIHLGLQFDSSWTGFDLLFNTIFAALLENHLDSSWTGLDCVAWFFVGKTCIGGKQPV